MNIGGSASNNGVKFISDNYTTKFIMQKDNSYSITTERRKQIKGAEKFIKKTPLIKGLYTMITISPIIPIIVAMSILMELFPLDKTSSYYRIFFIAVGVAYLVTLIYVIKNILFKVKETWKYHGAEHKTIFAYESEMELSLKNVRGCPRTAKRCGTNLVVFVVLFFAILSFCISFTSVRLVLSFTFAYELFDLKQGDKLPIINLFFKFGYWCQQNIFTLEPSDIQLTASIDTMNKLIEIESNSI